MRVVTFEEIQDLVGLDPEKAKVSKKETFFEGDKLDGLRHKKTNKKSPYRLIGIKNARYFFVKKEGTDSKKVEVVKWVKKMLWSR